METHWSAYLTLSIVHFMAYPETMKGEGPILDTIRQIAEDEFFTGIEVTWMRDPAVRKQVRQILETSRLPAAFGAQPTLLTQKLDLNCADSAGRARAVSQLKEDIDQAVELGISKLATLSGTDPGEAERPSAFDLLTDSIMQVCEYGRSRGVSITLETFDRTVDKRALIGPAGEAAVFSARIRQVYPDFGLMYDLSHLPLLEEEVSLALHALKDHLVHAHVGNCVKKKGLAGFGDQHPRFGFPGGENDTEELVDFLRGLFEIGYLRENPQGPKPWVGIEVKPMPGETSEALLAGSKRVWIEAWARL